MREKREAWGERVSAMERERDDKILIYLLQLSYSVILPLELHCSTIANFFAILDFYKSGCRWFFGPLC